MNAPLRPEQQALIDNSISLDDKFTLERGRAFMTGTQALLRLMMLQRQADEKAGLNTAGFITGYRGSPLGNVDLTASKAKKYLEKAHVNFIPA
jgi:indolepyruvate ferredoxin oxidoreductase